MSDAGTAQLIAGASLLLGTGVLSLVGRKDLVASVDGSYTSADGTTHAVKKGDVIAPADAKATGVPVHSKVRRSVLAALIVGKDHRTSTSKTVVFLWTLAVAFGLLSLLIAMWLGDEAPWKKQVGVPLQPEYLLLLGGPFAAAILAKAATAGDAASKSAGPVGEASPAQLVTDDDGNAELGDFQYVLFNLIALAFFLGDFIGDLKGGFPQLPELLTGLVLTSSGAYAAKKFIELPAPTLLSVVPASAAGKATVQVFGTNLVAAPGAGAVGAPMKPTVLFGSVAGEVTAQDKVLGNDRLTVKIPAGTAAASAPVSVVRADGVIASTASGSNSVPFDVIA
jgi:hypothetical protein